MRVLLDTNAYVALRRGDPRIAKIVRDAELLEFSMIVAAELLFGFRNGGRFEGNLADLEVFLAQACVTLRDVTWVTADRFGRIAAGLRSAGKPIPTNDIWIAAHAFETGAELITFDAHFLQVAGLPLRLIT